VALVTISLSAFSYYSVKIYVRWLENPIVLEMDEKLAEIYEIPFPTVRKSASRRTEKYLVRTNKYVCRFRFVRTSKLISECSI
jgi:hypothetical protein